MGMYREMDKNDYKKFNSKKAFFYLRSSMNLHEYIPLEIVKNHVKYEILGCIWDDYIRKRYIYIYILFYI